MTEWLKIVVIICDIVFWETNLLHFLYGVMTLLSYPVLEEPHRLAMIGRSLKSGERSWVIGDWNLPLFSDDLHFRLRVV